MKCELVNMSKTGKGPVAKSKVGRFEVSTWNWKRFVQARNDYEPDREIDVQRACVRYSRWNRITREWEETRIWCSVDELRSLVQALDGLNCTEEEEEGGE